MDKKLFQFISTIIGACATIAIAIITFLNVKYATAINTSIGILTTAIIDILSQFIEEKNKKWGLKK